MRHCLTGLLQSSCGLPRNDVSHLSLRARGTRARQSIETSQIVILNWFQDLTDAKCSEKLKVGKMLNTDDNNGATELALQHDMVYGL